MQRQDVQTWVPCLDASLPTPGPCVCPCGAPPSGSHLGLTPRQASGWPVCVPVHAPPSSWTWDRRQGCMWPRRCVWVLSVCFCCSCQLLLSCLLAPKMHWQPEAWSRHPSLQFPGQLNSSGNKDHVMTNSFSFILKIKEVFIKVNSLQQDFWSKLSLNLVFDK